MTGNKNSLEISQKLFGFSLMKEAVRNEDDTGIVSLGVADIGVVEKSPNKFGEPINCPM